MKDYTRLPDQDGRYVPAHKRLFFEYLGYISCEIAFGIWGSGTTFWSKLLKVEDDGKAWALASKLYNIGNYFYSKGY